MITEERTEQEQVSDSVRKEVIDVTDPVPEERHP